VAELREQDREAFVGDRAAQPLEARELLREQGVGAAGVGPLDVEAVDDHLRDDRVEVRASPLLGGRGDLGLDRGLTVRIGSLEGDSLLGTADRGLELRLDGDGEGLGEATIVIGETCADRGLLRGRRVEALDESGEVDRVDAAEEAAAGLQIEGPLPHGTGAQKLECGLVEVRRRRRLGPERLLEGRESIEQATVFGGLPGGAIEGVVGVWSGRSEGLLLKPLEPGLDLAVAKTLDRVEVRLVCGPDRVEAIDLRPDLRPYLRPGSGLPGLLEPRLEPGRDLDAPPRIGEAATGSLGEPRRRERSCRDRRGEGRGSASTGRRAAEAMPTCESRREVPDEIPGEFAVEVPGPGARAGSGSSTGHVGSPGHSVEGSHRGFPPGGEDTTTPRPGCDRGVCAIFDGARTPEADPSQLGFGEATAFSLPAELDSTLP
jgi:hypothetical protein